MLYPLSYGGIICEEAADIILLPGNPAETLTSPFTGMASMPTRA
jgi:hypothetical protein